MDISMNAIAFTFARGGSKGVPRKNIRMLDGKPLIAHSIGHVADSKTVAQHIVSTDDLEIAEVAKKFGAEVPFMRPAELATDSAAEILSWKHALGWVKQSGRDCDVFVSVPATAPMRRPEDIDRCVEQLLATKADLVLCVTASHHSPYFNMVNVDDAGATRLMLGDAKVTRRQDAPKAFNITTVAYAARPEYILGANSLWDGKVSSVEVSAESAIDIDTELDFEVAEFLKTRSRR